LPPISSEVFAEKVIAAQATSSAAATKAAYEKTCTACEKTYFSENAFYNHVGSQKHLKQVAFLRKARGPVADDASSIVSSTLDSQVTVTVDIESESESESEAESDSEDEVAAMASNLEKTTLTTKPVDAEKKKVVVPVKRCLFCNYESPSITLNVHHMERIHNMFIPERQYLVDLEGLIGALYEKINVYQECLTCGKLKPSVFGLQTHMRDKGHCSIPFHTEEEQLEIGEFYDFRSTYSDDEDEEDEEDEATGGKARGGVKLGARREAKEEVEDSDEEMEDPEGWETDSSTSSLDSADLTAVPLGSREHRYEKLDRHPHHSSEDPRPHKSADGFHSHAHKHAHAAYYSEYELHLPSGRAVGHRSLAKYYKQNLHNHPSPAERQEQYMIEMARGSDDEEEVDERVARRNDRERGRALNTRADGGRGMMGVTESKKREVAVLEKRARKQEYRDRGRFQWGNNKQSNSQKHFRVSPSHALRNQTAANILLGSPSAVIAYALTFSFPFLRGMLVCVWTRV
jgi:pre-60S factor REI1